MQYSSCEELQAWMKNYMDANIATLPTREALCCRSNLLGNLKPLDNKLGLCRTPNRSNILKNKHKIRLNVSLHLVQHTNFRVK
jgi:hypothetical protein